MFRVILISMVCIIAQKFAYTQIIKQFSFERLPIQYREMGMEYGTPDALSISTEWKKDSAKSTRIILRASDPEAQWGNKRAEYTVINNTSTPDTRLRWYKFSTFQRSADWKPDTREKIWPFQFHDRSNGRCSASPSLAMEVINNRFRVQVRWSTKDYCDFKDSRTGKTFDLIPVPFDQTNDWVIYYDPRADANGRIKIWLNDSLIFDYTGPCHFIGSTFPYFKMGLYAWHWMNPVPAGLPTYHIGFIDALSIYGGDTSLAPVTQSFELVDIRRSYIYAQARPQAASYVWNTGQTGFMIEVNGVKGTTQTFTCTITDKEGKKINKSITITF